MAVNTKMQKSKGLKDHKKVLKEKAIAKRAAAAAEQSKAKKAIKVESNVEYIMQLAPTTAIEIAEGKHFVIDIVAVACAVDNNVEVPVFVIKGTANHSFSNTPVEFSPVAIESAITSDTISEIHHKIAINKQTPAVSTLDSQDLHAQRKTLETEPPIINELVSVVEMPATAGDAATRVARAAACIKAGITFGSFDGLSNTTSQNDDVKTSLHGRKIWTCEEIRSGSFFTCPEEIDMAPSFTDLVIFNMKVKKLTTTLPSASTFVDPAVIDCKVKEQVESPAPPFVDSAILDFTVKKQRDSSKEGQSPDINPAGSEKLKAILGIDRDSSRMTSWDSILHTQGPSPLTADGSPLPLTPPDLPKAPVICKDMVAPNGNHQVACGPVDQDTQFPPPCHPYCGPLTYMPGLSPKQYLAEQAIFQPHMSLQHSPQAFVPQQHLAEQEIRHSHMPLLRSPKQFVPHQFPGKEFFPHHFNHQQFLPQQFGPPQYLQEPQFFQESQFFQEPQFFSEQFPPPQFFSEPPFPQHPDFGHQHSTQQVHPAVFNEFVPGKWQHVPVRQSWEQLSYAPY